MTEAAEPAPDKRKTPRGFPDTAEFLATDSDMSSLVFRRFHTVAIRNLLFLEGRLAALESHQQLLDGMEPADSTAPRSNTSWEEFARLAINGSDDKGCSLGIPDSALREWDIRGTPKTTKNDAEYILGEQPKDKYYGANAKKPAEPPEKVLLVQAKWRTALAIQEATKDYRQ